MLLLKNEIVSYSIEQEKGRNLDIKNIIDSHIYSFFNLFRIIVKKSILDATRILTLPLNDS